MTIKRICFVQIFILFFVTISFSQKTDSTQYKSKVGISYSSFGDNDVIRFQELTGGASYHGENFHSFGIGYLHELNKWLSFESGIEYSKHNISVYPNLPPGSNNNPYPAIIELINIPISVRFNFLKYLFINTGFLFDMDISNFSTVDKQTGIGALTGLGINYDFNFGISVFANPYLKAHSLIPFTHKNYPQRIIESGVRFGIMYQL